VVGAPGGDHLTPAYELHTGDCIPIMRQLRQTGAQFPLIFADPPFNINYQYDAYDDNRPTEAYLKWSLDWMSEAAHLLAHGGAFWLAIGDKYAAHLAIIADNILGLKRQAWVIWHYRFGQNQKNNFARCKTHLLYWTKSNRTTFNADSIRVPSLRQIKYGDKRANPKGKLPSDVWDFPRVCGTFKERTDHPCQMPLAVLERIILGCSNEGDHILDPFAGSGTTLHAALKHNRRTTGIELSEAYAAAIRSRLAQATSA
jgi:DNA modification methylase